MRPGTAVPALRAAVLAALILGSIAAGAEVAAPPTGQTYRIGWLSQAANPGNLDAFRNGLRTLGYVEGTHFVLDERYADGGFDQLVAAAADLERGRRDVVVADGSSAASALKRTAAATPVVFVSGDPVVAGLVRGLSSPGGTMTGLAVVATELNVKRLELIREMFPRRSRVGVLYEPRHVSTMLPAVEAGARSLGLQVTRLEVGGAADLEAAFARATRERVSVVMPVSSALFHAEKQRLVALAAKHRLPTVYENRAFPEAGGLMSYGPDMQDVFRRAAAYVDRILKGARPAELPVEEPTKFELVINGTTARALGLAIPGPVLLRTDRVIE